MTPICKNIILNGLNLYPSNIYSATLDGIFNFNTNIEESDVFYDGTYFGRSKMNTKDMTLTVALQQNLFYTPEYIQAIQHLNYILQQPQIKLEFVLDDNNNIKYECVVTCSNRADTEGLIVCTLHLTDPHIYLAEESVLVLEKQMTGGFSYPTTGLSIPTDGFSFVETTLGDIGEVVNNGYNTIYPRIEIEGDGSNFSITNKTTGEVLYINYTISGNKKIIIDCDPKTRKIKLNNSISLMKYKSGQFISIPHGSNEIVVDYNGDCSVTLYYKEAY